MPGLEVRDAILRFGEFEMHCNFTVPAEGCSALIGASGAGKSTLVALIAGFERLISGQVFFEGRDITGLPPSQRPVATMFQEHNLFPHLNVFENVGLGVHPGLRLSRTDRESVMAAIERVGLSGMRKRRPADLSGGERQRAALARVLVQRRPLLLLDEPFAALGPALRREMLDFVDSIRREYKRTVLLVSHLPSDALRIAEKTAFMHRGRILAEGPTTKLFRSPEIAELRAYLGEVDFRDGGKSFG